MASNNSSQLRHSTHAMMGQNGILTVSAWTHRTGDPTGLSCSFHLTREDAEQLISQLNAALGDHD